MRFLFPLLLTMSTLIAASSAQSGGSQIGPSGGQAAAAIAGGAAAIAVVTYLVIPKQKVIEGCISTQNGLQLTADAHHTALALTGDSSGLHAGTRARLKGKYHGKQTFEVHKLLKEEGPCSSAPN